VKVKIAHKDKPFRVRAMIAHDGRLQIANAMITDHGQSSEEGGHACY
jgi:hypothetical protein